ncbi:hypothetical protein ABE225_24845 [Priestia megaterium]
MAAKSDISRMTLYQKMQQK